MTEDPSSINAPLADTPRPEKALWYQEVLSLDPASRIFLPYARLLADTGRRMEAIEVLRSGLSRHPEFLDARLLLIDLLHDAGMDAAAGLEASGIIESLSQCSALWEIWSRLPGVRADQAAMLLFFGATFREGGPGLADVFDAGMKALRKKKETPLPPDTPVVETSQEGPSSEEKHTEQVSPVVTKASPAAPEPSQETPAPARSFVMSDDTPWYSLDAVPDDEDLDDEDDTPDPRSVPLSVTERFFADPGNGSTNVSDTNDQPSPASHAVPRSPQEGKSSLCTRSMARILEEQGATGEAADIYRELLEVSSSPEERAELNAKLDSLRQGTEPSVSEQPSSSGIMDMLETLAVRLENKSRA